MLYHFRLWGDPKVQRTLITTHKKYPVIARIAEKMREHGYNRTPEEINTRIKNLKCFYNRVKKDMEMGVTTTSNWKHYDDMDEILSRPIFGNNARMQENNIQSESQSSQSPKDSVAHLVEPEMRIKEENMTDDDGKSGIEIAASSSNNDMIIPKDEPLDIDDGNLLDSEMDEDFDDDFAESNDEFQPPLAKVQRTTSEISLNSLPPLDKLQSRPVEIKLIETPTTSQSRVVISSSATTTQSTASTTGKISLVPTNVLLKPKTQVTPSTPIITINTQQQQQPSLVTNQIPTSSATSQGMKVLFVNAMPQCVNSTAAPSSNASQTVTMTATPMVQKTMPKVMPPLHPTIPPSTRISVIPQPNPIAISQKTPVQKGTGFRHLLTQLIQLQNENLLMQRQRLNVEKQRLEVEKTFGNRIVDLLTNIQRQNTLTLTKTLSTTPGYRLRRERKINNMSNHDSTDDEQDGN